MLGITYYRSGKFTEALEALRKLPPTPEILYYIGKIYAYKNIWDEALEKFRNIVKQKPQSLDDSLWIELATKEIDAIEKIIPGRLEDLALEIQSIVKSAPPQEEYPEAGAIILLQEESLAVKENASTTKIHRIIKMFNQRGIEEFGEIMIGYEDTYEYVEINFARIIQQDGSIYTLPKRYFKTTTPYSHYPLYSNFKYQVISFPGLAEGTIVDYQITKHQIQLIDSRNFYKKFFLQGQEPILLQRYLVSVPSDQKIQFKLLDIDIESKLEKVDTKRVYTWELRNQPAIVFEQGMPCWDEISPQILVTSFENWHEIYSWWQGLFKEQLIIDDTMKELINEMIQDKNGEEDKVKAIYEWVTTNIRFVAVEYSESGFKPHSTTEVFKNKYGDCKDKSLLLVAMLRESGIDAYPALIGVHRRDLIKDIPMMQFNHCIVVAKTGDKYHFLDPAAETCPYDYLPAQDQNKTAMVFANNDYLFLKTPLIKADHNYEVREMEININVDGSINIEKKGSAYGERALLLRSFLQYQKPIERQESIEREIFQFCPGGILTNYSLCHLDSASLPLIITQEFNVPDWLNSIDPNKFSFSLPTVVINILGTDKLARRHPIEYGSTECKEYNIKIKLVQNANLVTVPKSVFLKNDFASFLYDTEYKNDVINIKIFYIRDKTRIPVDKYQEWRAFVNEIRQKLTEEIVLAY